MDQRPGEDAYDGPEEDRRLADVQQQAAATREILEALGRAGADPSEVLDIIIERARLLCRARVAQLYLADGDIFRLSRVSGDVPEDFRRYVEEHPVGPGRDSLLGRVAQDRRTQQIGDVLADPGYGRHDLQDLAGFRTLMSAPMLLNGDVIGILSVWRTEASPFDDGEVEVLSSFAVQAAVVVRQVDLVAALGARSDELAAKVTQLEVLLAELDTKRAELEVASRHKSEFLASMSHELRTPLNAVIGFSEVLLDRMFGELNERQEEYLRDIWTSGKHLLELLNEILDLSKVEAGRMVLEPSLVSVRALLDYVLSLVRDRAAAHALELRLEVADDVGIVWADELRLKQVVLNLVSNAVKFTPDGGRVEVEAVRDGGDVVVRVADTGVGVPPEDRERIFESFQQGQRGAPKEEGTGLGLTLSRRIVSLFDGSLWLEPEGEVGSVFVVRLPLPAVEPASDDDSDGTRTVLLVDDDRASLDLMTAYLTSSPVRVLHARDGVEALALARSAGPAAVVLDIRLPRMDGWEVLRRIKADPATSAIPVVVASIIDERQRGLRLGAAAYLLKPVRRDDLLDALRVQGIESTAGSAP